MEQKKLLIEETKKTPLIKGDLEEGFVLIQGKSIPEDAKDFYLPLFNWMVDLVETSAPSIKIQVDLEYFNTSTSSILLNLFRLIEKISHKKKTEIIWIYEEDDIDMEEVGLDYKLMIGDILTLKSKRI